MNSHSGNPIYLCGKVDKENILTISSIGIYEKHILKKSIDIVTDKNGNFIPYQNKGKDSSHSHLWNQENNGNIGRKKHKESNSLPINPDYQIIINKIVEFNKSKKTWNLKTNK